MGVVYEAEHTSLSRRVALKVLFDDDEKAAKRFQQEGRAMAKLTHPHIVAVVDYIAEVGERPMLVMELLQGQPLAKVLRREGKLATERAVKIATQILRGLAAAHDAGVVHRDVKPSNVFLVVDDIGEETVKLLDFGVAKLFDVAAIHTTLGGVVGTPSYLAPEQLRLEKGKKIDGRADVHAVGIILYEMLAGRRPWSARHPTEISLEIASKPRTPLREHRPDLPEALGDVVDRALSVDREERHRDADSMLRALTRVSLGPSIKDTIIDQPPPPRPGDSPVRRTLPMEGRPKHPVDRRRPVALALVAGFVMGGIATGTTFMLVAQNRSALATGGSSLLASPAPTSPPAVTCPSVTCLPPLDPSPCPSIASSVSPASSSGPSSTKPRAARPPPSSRDPGKTIGPPGDLF